MAAIIRKLSGVFFGEAADEKNPGGQPVGLQIGVFGATGDVGKVFVAGALERGYRVNALVRDPSKLTDGDVMTGKNLTVYKGDAGIADNVAPVVEKSDLVVVAIGSSGNADPIMGTTIRNILAAKPKRLMVITTLGCGGSSSVVKMVLHCIVNKCNSTFQDYEDADDLVRGAACPWVLVRPNHMENEPATGKYLATSKGGISFGGPVSKADVAKFLLDHVEDKKWDGTPVAIYKGDKNEFDA